MSIVGWYGDFKNKVTNKIAQNAVRIPLSIMGILMLAISASAGIAEDLTNFTTIIGNATSGFTGFFINMMVVFMQPPLIYFVVLGFFLTFVHLAASFLMKRGKK